MRFSDIQSSFKIDTFELAKGCPELCHHCGCFSLKEGDEKTFAEEMRVREMTRDEIDKALMMPVDSQGTPLINFFAPVVTTGIGSEFSRRNNFSYLASRMNELSKGRSRMIFIMHGVHEKNQKMIGRFREIVQLAVSNVIAGIILTIDNQRHKMRDNLDSNVRSYAETLRLLKPLLSSTSNSRISASIQGDDKYNGIDGVNSALNVLGKSLHMAGLNSREFSRLNLNLRGYSSLGRAQDFVLEEESMDCTVIPDPDFEGTIDRSYLWRGWVDFEGNKSTPQKIIVKARQHNPKRSYNELVEKESWQNIEFDFCA